MLHEHTKSQRVDICASRVGTGTSVQDRQAIHAHLKNNLTKVKPPMYQARCAASARHPLLSCSDANSHAFSQCRPQVTGGPKDKPDVYVREPMNSLILEVSCQPLGFLRLEC